MTHTSQPQPMEASTPHANSIAAQIQTQLGNKATVTVTGSAVNVWSKYGISEQHMSNLKVTLPATSVPFILTGISFSVKDADGNAMDLDDSARAVLGFYAYSLKQSATAAYNNASTRGDASYTATFPNPSVIDTISEYFGPHENTDNKQKRVMSFRIEGEPIEYRIKVGYAFWSTTFWKSDD
jgi:hypothetical protein